MNRPDGRYLHRTIQSATYENPNQVLALSVLRILGGTRKQILIVTRDPESNFTHPNVISVPTKRVSQGVADELLQSLEIADKKDLSKPDDPKRVVYYEPNKIISLEEASCNPLRQAVEMVMASKLGIADELEKKLISYKAWVTLALNWAARYANGTDARLSSEPIRMTNIAVHVESSGNVFPKNTASYSSMKWIDFEYFKQIAESKDPKIIGLDPAHYSVGGVCIESTRLAMENDSFSK
ncbi:MAG: hypothetical protein US89_C0005G0120 [Candidatus Peregrinibacteria bacterium GW2011_GWF2_38_29]|nr:MAG: hypothetical protein US89_C0005G0120 [Candidatus Peregrinibacteria bacterium GW2011_GWF2_38_29]HBB02706.1 hypothetical protein [Candidatus Peregrinibacteria bacterium]